MILTPEMAGTVEGSSFDRSVGCVFTRNVVQKLNLYGMSVILNAITTIVAGVLLSMSLIGDRNDLWLPGIILHCVSVGWELFLTTYPARYFFGLTQWTKESSKSSVYLCCPNRYTSYSNKTYLLWALYIIFTISFYYSMDGNHTLKGYTPNGPEQLLINNAEIGVIIYLVSFNLITYWTVVFPPICSSVRYENNKKPWFYNMHPLGIDSSFSLAVLITFNYVSLNVAFGMYYVDYVVNLVMISLSSLGLLVAITLYSIETIILYRVGYFDDVTLPITTRISIVAGAPAVSSLACFLYAMLGFYIDPVFPDASYRLKLFFIVQGGLVLLAVAIVAIILSVFFVIWLIEYCKTTLPADIDQARKQVEGFAHIDINTISYQGNDSADDFA